MNISRAGFFPSDSNATRMSLHFAVGCKSSVDQRRNGNISHKVRSFDWSCCELHMVYT